LRSLRLNDNQLTGLYVGDARVATLFEPRVSPSCLGSIPAGLGQLSNLQQLFLYNNKLTGL
jgi:Leucine-rich repeat (LRR) protein